VLIVELVGVEVDGLVLGVDGVDGVDVLGVGVLGVGVVGVTTEGGKITGIMTVPMVPVVPDGFMTETCPAVKGLTGKQTKAASKKL
jgi:hypothetical protein